MPWSPAKERAGGEACNRLNFRGVDDVLHVNLHAGWEAYNSAGVSQVPHPLPTPPAERKAHQAAPGKIVIDPGRSLTPVPPSFLSTPH